VTQLYTSLKLRDDHLRADRCLIRIQGTLSVIRTQSVVTEVRWINCQQQHHILHHKQAIFDEAPALHGTMPRSV